MASIYIANTIFNIFPTLFVDASSNADIIIGGISKFFFELILLWSEIPILFFVFLYIQDKLKMWDANVALILMALMPFIAAIITIIIFGRTIFGIYNSDIKILSL